jgi:phosphonoacetate hydrolase
VVICLDGSADEYLDCAMARERMPNLSRMSARGWRGFARAAMPTFTNVNNSSIVTGRPPSVHGIGGNFFFDTASGEEVMMNSSKFLRVETIFPHAQRAGRKVAVVTAKEKLRDIFASGLISEGGIAFSSEKAKHAVTETHGVADVESLVGPTPPIYSGDASLYVLKAGVAMLRRGMADFLYLSTTDYMQHKHAPEDAEALDFYAAIDVELGRLLDLGAVIGVTADHGMNAKQTADGAPNVIYLETELAAAFGDGFRVILPITDPYVAHHGALGSFAQVHLPPGLAAAKVRYWLLQRAGITECHERTTAARLMELPEDRMGDLVVASARNVVLGRTPAYHDLTALAGPLRSHGGRYEEMVPLVFSEPLNSAYATRAAGDVRNFDIFEFTCNGTH